MLQHIAAEQHIIHKQSLDLQTKYKCIIQISNNRISQQLRNTKSNKQHAMTILDQSPNLDTCMKKRNSTPRHQQATTKHPARRLPIHTER